MSNEKNEPRRDSEVAELKAMVTELMATNKTLQTLLAERVEAKIEHEPEKYQDYVRQQEAKTVEWQRKQDAFQAAQKAAAESGSHKFLVCIFSRSAENDQFARINLGEKPWETTTLPTHPWKLIGVDAPDDNTARLMAADKYNRVQGIIGLTDGVTHSMFRVGSDGKPADEQGDIERFRQQVMRLKSGLDHGQIMPGTALSVLAR